MSYCVKLAGKDLIRCLNNTESVGLRVTRLKVFMFPCPTSGQLNSLHR